jgi:hypothetical protein
MPFWSLCHSPNGYYFIIKPALSFVLDARGEGEYNLPYV